MNQCSECQWCYFFNFRDGWLRPDVLRARLQHAPIHADLAMWLQIPLVLQSALRYVHRAHRGVYVQVIWRDITVLVQINSNFFELVRLNFMINDEFLLLVHSVVLYALDKSTSNARINFLFRSIFYTEKVTIPENIFYDLVNTYLVQINFYLNRMRFSWMH